MHANKYTHTSCMIHVQCTLCTLTRRKKDAHKNVKMIRRCHVGLEILLLVWCRLPMMERHQFEELPIHYTNVTANISLPIPFPDHPNRCHQMCDCAHRRTGKGGERDFPLEFCVRWQYVTDGKLHTTATKTTTTTT